MISPTAISLADGTGVCLCAVDGLSELSERDLVFTAVDPRLHVTYFCLSWLDDSDVAGLLDTEVVDGDGALAQVHPSAPGAFFCALWLSGFSSMSGTIIDRGCGGLLAFNNDRPCHSHTTTGGMAY